MGNLFTEAMGNYLTTLVGNVLTTVMGKVLVIYTLVKPEVKKKEGREDKEERH